MWFQNSDHDLQLTSCYWSCKNQHIGNTLLYCIFPLKICECSILRAHLLMGKIFNLMSSAGLRGTQRGGG